MEMRVAGKAILIQVTFAGLRFLSGRSGVGALNTRSVARTSFQLGVMKLVPSCFSAGEEAGSFEYDLAITEASQTWKHPGFERINSHHGIFSIVAIEQSLGQIHQA